MKYYAITEPSGLVKFFKEDKFRGIVDILDNEGLSAIYYFNVMYLFYAELAIEHLDNSEAPHNTMDRLKKEGMEVTQAAINSNRILEEELGEELSGSLREKAKKEASFKFLENVAGIDKSSKG